MNELYNETIERNGKIYYYDPDRDIYYRRHGPIGTFDRWSWIVVSIILLALVIFLDWYKG